MNKQIVKMQNYKNQQGVTLILTLVVLLAMTIIGLTATDSSNLQALLARNSQFRMEVFNASNAELNAQLDSYRATPSGTISRVITALTSVDEPGTVLNLGDTDGVGGDPFIVERAVNTAFTKDIKLTHVGGCPSSGTGGVRCFLFRIDSSATLVGTNIRSDQVQTFSVIVQAKR